MTEPVAAIDLGSNTFKLTIASVVDGSVTLLLARAEHVRISEGLQSSGRIQEEHMELAVATIQTMCTEARSAGARSILVVGTAALRMASNTSVLIDRVRLATGLDIDVISSEREARLTTAGALSQLDSAGDLIVADIGGASTELIHTRDGAILQWTSLPIGSGLLTDQFRTQDPPIATEIAQMQ
ncbi:MAG TPA: hypothetical protein PK819_14045, partial [Thermomicrobiales bacterium]|nr:hypothetical protein [Thermomicrobiales bacterium]